MLGYKGPAQPSPMLGDALNAGYSYLEVRCLGCDTHQTVALDIVRRPKATTPIHELERYMRCKNCSELQGRPLKRSHLVALRPTKILCQPRLHLVTGRTLKVKAEDQIRPPAGNYPMLLDSQECRRFPFDFTAVTAYQNAN
jgi:hypothetical protein